MKLKNIKNSAIVLNSVWICKGTDNNLDYNTNKTKFTVDNIFWYISEKMTNTTDNYIKNIEKFKNNCNINRDFIKKIIEKNLERIKEIDKKIETKGILNKEGSLNGYFVEYSLTYNVNDIIKKYLINLIINSLKNTNELYKTLQSFNNKYTKDELDVEINKLKNSENYKDIIEFDEFKKIIKNIKPKTDKPVVKPVVDPKPTTNGGVDKKETEEEEKKKEDEERIKKEDEERIKKEEEEKKKKEEEKKKKKEEEEKKNAELKEELSKLETKIGSLTSTKIQEELDTILNKDEFKNIDIDNNNKILINQIRSEISSKIEKEEIEKKNKEIEKIKNDKEKLKNTLREDLNKIKNESKDKIFQDIQTALNIVLNIGSYKDLFNDIEFKKMIDKIENIIKEKLTEELNKIKNESKNKKSSVIKNELSVILQSESCKNFSKDGNIKSLIEEINKIIEEKEEEENGDDDDKNKNNDDKNKNLPPAPTADRKKGCCGKNEKAAPTAGKKGCSGKNKK